MNGAEIPLKIRFNVFDVKSPLLSTSKLRKHGHSVLLDQQQTIQKGDEDTERSKLDSRFIPDIWLRRATECDEHIVAPAQGENTGNLEQCSHQEYQRHTVGSAGRGKSSRSPDDRRAAQTNDRLKHQHENSQRFLGRDGQDGRKRGMRRPRRQETQCCMSEQPGGVEDQDHPTTRKRDM